MTLTAANPGGWSLNEVLTSVQMTFLQNELLKAIDGVNGGSYTLAAPLTIGGADVTFASDVFLTGTTSFGSITIPTGETLTIAAGANAVFAGDAAFTSGADLDLASGSVIDMAFGSALLVGGSVNIEGGAQLVLLTGSHMFVEGSSDIEFDTGDQIIIDDESETFRSMMVPIHADGWLFNFLVNAAWVQQTIAGGESIIFPLPIRPGDTLENVFIRLDGAAGHGSLPAGTDRAEVRLYRAAIDGTISLLASCFDTVGSVPAYEASHNLLLDVSTVTTGTMPQLATINPFYVMVIGESGPNAVAGLQLQSVTGNDVARSIRTNQGLYS